MVYQPTGWPSGIPKTLDAEQRKERGRKAASARNSPENHARKLAAAWPTLPREQRDTVLEILRPVGLGCVSASDPRTVAVPRRKRNAPAVTQEPGRQFVDVATAAKYLGVGDRTLRRYIAEGQLPAYKVGGLLRLRFSDVEALAVPVNPGEVSV